MLALIQIIITNIYDPLVIALNEMPLLLQSIDNGYFVFTWSTLIATVLTTSIFFAFAFLPIYIIKFLRNFLK